MVDSSLQLPLDFYHKKTLSVKFSRLNISSDAELFLIRPAEEKIKICEGMANCGRYNREQGKVKHSLAQLIRQRVYQGVGKLFSNPGCLARSISNQLLSCQSKISSSVTMR